MCGLRCCDGCEVGGVGGVLLGVCVIVWFVDVFC